MGMKNVDKNIDSATSNDLGRKTRHNAMKMDIRAAVGNSSPFVVPNFLLPKRRFWKEEQKINPDFRYTFQWFVAKTEYSRP
jgi:hypothetical protein